MSKFARYVRLVPLILGGLVPLATFVACAPATESTDTARPNTPAATSVEIASTGATVRHTRADADFMRGMLHHHAQAITMTDLVEQRSGEEELRLLARRIALSQEGEMEMMVRWLERRGEEVPDLEHGHHRMHAEMPGMLTQEQLDRLEAASGPEFDRLFLEYMIEHHEGALVMVEELLGSEGAAQEPETFQFAMHVDSDQRVEIERMREMLEQLP